jgi:hypothetical protein
MRAFRALTIAFVAAASLSSAQDLELRKVLLTGEPAPGVGPDLVDEIGTYVDVFNTSPFQGQPILGPHGAMGIVAVYGGDGNPETRDGIGSAVWRAVDGTLSFVTRSGELAPGTNGASFFGFPEGSAGTAFDLGDGLAFTGSIRSAEDAQVFGLWSTRGGVHKLLQQGEPLLGMPSGAGAFQFATAGRGPAVLVEANWSCPEGCSLRDEGLWRDLDGTLRPVAKRGDPAPGFRSGDVFDDSGNASANTGPIHSWNGSETGRVIFNGYVTGPRIDAGNNEGIWMEGPAGLVLIAREGQKVPGKSGFRWGSRTGFQSFGDFDALRVPILTASGRALWGASINSGQYADLGGLYTNRSGTVVQLLQSVFVIGSSSPPLTAATPAPGFGPGHFFRQVFSARMTDEGEIYFDADVAHQSSPQSPLPGIFRIRAGSNAITLVVRAGAPAPGLPGLTLAEANIGRLFETGDYVWRGRLQGPGVDAGNDLALFLTDPAGVTRPLLRTGDSIDVQGDGSDLRALAGFDASEGPRGGGTVVQQAYELRFADGSAGVFLGRVVP